MSKKKREPCFLIDLNGQETDKKVKISPIGQVTGVDGRVYSVDAETLVKKMKEQKIDIVLNVNHGYDESGEKAAGWFDINTVEQREDGIYASMTPTSIGTTLIDEKHFRYLSPEYRISWNGDIREVRDIVGVGLVNRPNVLDDALNKEENPEEDDAVNKEKVATAEELQAQLDAEKETNKQLRDDAKKSKIERAVQAGELMPNRQEFAMGLDGKQLDDFLALNKEDAKHLQEDVNPDKPDDAPSASDEEKEVNRQLGLDDGGEK